MTRVIVVQSHPQPPSEKAEKPPEGRIVRPPLLKRTDRDGLCHLSEGTALGIARIRARGPKRPIS
jgi:hypothetical protein